MIDISNELSGSYTVHTQQEEFLEVHMVASQSWPWFLGHFPQMPVLPAVAIIDITQFLLCRWQKAEAKLNRLSDFKLKKPIQPSDRIQIKMSKLSATHFQVIWQNQNSQPQLLAELTLDIVRDLN